LISIEVALIAAPVGIGPRASRALTAARRASSVSPASKERAIDVLRGVVVERISVDPAAESKRSSGIVRRFSVVRAFAFGRPLVPASTMSGDGTSGNNVYFSDANARLPAMAMMSQTVAVTIPNRIAIREMTT
jgi:hypothetical protein